MFSYLKIIFPSVPSFPLMLSHLLLMPALQSTQA